MGPRERSAASQGGRNDDAADSSGLRRLESTLRIFDGHARLSADPASLDCQEIRLGIRFGAAVITGGQDEIEEVQRYARGAFPVVWETAP